MATQMVRPRAVSNGYQRRPAVPVMSNRLGSGTPVGDIVEPSRSYRMQTEPSGYPGAEASPLEAYNKSGDPMSNRLGEGTPVSAPGYTRYTGNNVNDMISNDRDFAFGRGDELYQNSKDRAANQGNLNDYYRAYGDEVYDPLIGGRGGYTADEAGRIDRTSELDNYMTPDSGYAGNFLTEEEGKGITGNPWDRAAYFNPDGSVARQNESAGRQRGAVDDMQTGLYESLDGQLGMSDEYGSTVDRTLDGSEGRVRGSYDPAALRADKTSLDRIRMTPEEEQAMVTKAGISGGMKYKAAADDMDARARAAGLNPLGAAAVRGKYLRNANADAADAMTGARVAASNARAGREATAEGIRMGGERTAADIGTGTELALSGQRLNAATTKEGIRLNSQRDIASRRADLAKTVGQARLGAEQGINTQQRNVDQFNTETGTGIATGIERDAAARAAEIAANRQKTNQSNQQQKWNQGYQRTGAASGMGQTVANARRDDQKEGRGYLQTQQQTANNNQQNEYNRQANIYATQGQLGQGTTANQQKKDAQPKWWEKLIGAGAQAAGAFAGG